jgi:glycosyltransferase involved in cell wall biosynthesis
VAAARPDWQLVLIGPVCKLDPAELPQRPNLHYLGVRSYAALPGYLAGWDVCLLPFARNEATRFISPTKTLEYMAAERPIVSTLIRDVALLYRDIVYLADSASAFEWACARALDAPPRERHERAQRARAVVGATSWQATVAAMAAEIRAAASRRDVPQPRRQAAAAAWA